jgi:hypothetical protein
MVGEQQGNSMGTAGERHGNGMGTAWERHGMCESASRLSLLQDIDTLSNLKAAVSKQTVGCDIIGVLLHTKREYDVGRMFAEWAVRLS